MNRVSYNMGRIAFAAGEAYEPIDDEFFMAYMRTQTIDIDNTEMEKIFHREGSEWRTGWMTAKKEAADFFAKSKAPEDE